MRILHPYMGLRPEDEKPTWDFLAQIRDKHDVVDRFMPLETDRKNGTDYAYFISEFWGHADLVVLEGDKVPTLADLDELIACKEWACCFPYPIQNWLWNWMSFWRDINPYTLGFVKFTKSAQEAFPSSSWPFDRFERDKLIPVDRLIEETLTNRFGPMHLHDHSIKHNHNAGAFVQD